MITPFDEVLHNLNIVDTTLYRACQEIEYAVRHNVYVHASRKLFPQGQFDEQYYVLLLVLARKAAEQLFKRIKRLPEHKRLSGFWELMLLCGVVEIAQQRYKKLKIRPAAVLLALVTQDKAITIKARRLTRAFFGTNNLSRILTDDQFDDKLEALYIAYSVPISNLLASLVDYLLQCIWGRMVEASVLARIRMKTQGPIARKTAPLWMTLLTNIDDSWLTK